MCLDCYVHLNSFIIENLFLSVGEKVDMSHMVPAVLTGEGLKSGIALAHCGMPAACPSNTVSVAVDTGNANLKAPSICVDGLMWVDYVALSSQTK